MKKFILMLISAVFLFSCGSTLDGEGAATAQKEFAVESFQSVEIYCDCDLTLIPSDSTKVVVESHQNLTDNLEVTMKRNNLIIKENQSVGDFKLYNVNVYYNPELNKIKLNKQARMKVSGTLKADEFSLVANDQTTVNESFIEIKELDLDASNQTQIKLTGTVINLDVSTSGQSQVELSELQTVEVDFKAENESFLTVYAMKNLNGTATDNSQVNYKGDPNKNTTEKDRAFIRQK